MTTKSLGQQDVLISQRQVGTVRVLSMYAYGTLSPRAYIRLGWMVQEREPEHATMPPIKGYRLRDLRGEVRLSEHADAVATLQWIDPQQAAHSSPNPYEWQIIVTAELDHQKIELIDRYRAGGDAKLYLQLWPVFVSHEHGRYDAEVRSFSFDVPRDNWLGVMIGLGVGRFLVLEVPLTTVNAEVFTLAARHLDRALKHLHDGNYNDAINTCRLAGDALNQIVEVTNKESFAAYLTPRVGERRAKEYANALGALRRLMEMTHHISSESPVFSRAEAIFIVQSLQHTLALVGELTVGEPGGS